MPSRLSSLAREQDAYDAVLHSMLREHSGEFVVFYGLKPAGFFDSYDKAFANALDLFGLDEVFLISQITEPVHETSSLAWDLGVMFGQ